MCSKLVGFIFLLHVFVFHVNKVNCKDSAQKKDNFVYYRASDVSQSDLNNNLLVLSGNAEISNNGYTVKADKIIFNTKSNILESIVDNSNSPEGNNRIKISTKTGDTIYCSNLKYDVNKNVGIAKNALLYKNDTIILAKTAKINNDGKYYCSDISLTTCKKKNPDWAIIVDNAIISKNNLFYIYGANLMISGVYFPVIKNIGIPYLLAETNKSGLKYPESVSFGSYGGLAIKNFGFYIYFNKERDLDCNISAFLGDGSIKFSLIHNYLKRDTYSGVLSFTLDKVSLYKIVYGFEESFKTSWELTWKHYDTGYKNYEFNSEVSLSGKNNEDFDFDTEKKIGINTHFKIKKFLKYLSGNVGLKYDKDFNTKIEKFNIPYFDCNVKNISFLKYFFFEVMLNGVVFYTNENRKKYVQDNHDIVMEDDVLSDKEVFSRENVYNFFKGVSSEKICNIFRSLSYELKSEIPFKFKSESINVSVVYNNRLFFSKYDKGVIKLRKYPYYIHSVDIKGDVNFKLASPKLVFDEFNRKNLLKIKELRFYKDIKIAVSFNPSLDKMQKTFGLGEAYSSEGNKTIDLFYHTCFGNLKNKESIVLNFHSNNYLSLVRNKNGEIANIKLINFSITTGYDFLKPKCKLNDIEASFNINLFKLKIESKCVFYPYQYSEVLVDKSREKIDKWFFDKKDGFFKSFLESVMNFSVDANLDLISNKPTLKKDNETNKNPKDKFLLNKEVKYDKFYLLENLNVKAKYTFGYKYNPIIKDKNISHLFSLNIATRLSKKCNVSISLIYDIKKNRISSFNINGVYDMHCWVSKFAVSVITDEKSERKFKYDVSIAPTINTFSFLSHTRSDNLIVNS